MLIVPLQPIPNQEVTVPLAGQSCLIHAYQKSTGLYVDLYVNDALIIGGVPARDAVKIVRNLYLGFIGDLAFFDTQGAADPEYPGLGSRWVLAYLTVSEAADE